jgi:glycosyltransferase involved in cell wall biosynthesis
MEASAENGFSPEAVVCLPTYRRPLMLAQTLRSLERQNAELPFAVIVVDNDSEGRSGAAIADEFFSSGALRGFCVNEESPGNCSACNRAFVEALEAFPRASFVLMLDDDERADPSWLSRMVGAARVTGADIVGGPVTPEFTVAPPPDLARHPVFWPAYDRSGPAPVIYGSGNFLIRAEVLRRVGRPVFDPRYNFLGGGDTDFFQRCRRAGCGFHWEHAARIIETVPQERLSRTWIFARGRRIGAINFRIDQRSLPAPFGIAKAWAKNFALLPIFAGRSIRLLREGHSAATARHHFDIALGRFAAAIGVEPEQYRPQDPAARP